MRRATALNNRKNDAHHGTYIGFASSRFAAPIELRTFIASKRDDFFAVDVMRNAPPSLNEMIEISGSMNNAVHLNRVTPNNVEHQI